jgi:uncharacterized protein
MSTNNRAPDSETEGLRLAPRRHSAFRLWAFKATERVLVALGGRGFYRRRYLRRGRFEVRHEVVPVAEPGLHGLRIVQFSDLHGGPFLQAGDLADVVDVILEQEADLIVFTGDVISRRAEEAQALAGDLMRLNAPLGVFGVFGNHDYHQRREAEIARALPSIRFLRGEGVRPAAHLPLFLLGVEDLEEAKRLEIEPARAMRHPGDLEIVLCHNPHGAERVASAATVLVLSGHSHGFQINLPWIRNLGPGHPGDRVELKGGAVSITSRGLGVVGVPLRLCARPDIVVIELRAQTSDQGGPA